MYCYTVRCQFQSADSSIPDRWLQWLKREHLDDVIRAGAESAEIVHMSKPESTWEIRYRFASRDQFQAYLNDHADRLRAEGLQAFPLDLGLNYSRTDGDVVFQC